MALPEKTELAAESADLQARVRRVCLSLRQDELLIPVQGIREITERLLRETKAREQSQFLADMARVGEAATRLHQEIVQFLTQAESSADIDQGAVQWTVRHDLRNLLNPIINYPEMWLEDADEFFLLDFVPDLKLLLGMGHRCRAYLDTILDSWSSPVALVETDPEFSRMSDLLDQLRELPERNRTPPGRVLLVDDNVVNRDILRRLLETLGHAVIEAENGREALEVLSRERVDLVLLDILMPEVNGYETLCCLKSNDALRDIPVVMISALNETDSIAGCIRLGAEDYLPRPYNPVVLKARVDSCLEKKRFREREREYLAQIERERRRADELLHVILPAPVVVELKETNRCLPKRFDRVAVLFADIVNFTPFCERHPPEVVVEHLQTLFESWEELSLRHGVQKIKTIGDAFMAACGLLEPVANPVLQCVQLGADMIAATQALPTGWNLRVGIHVGQVVAGVLGRRQYLYDLFGDTVNTAARMESHGVHGGIVLTADACRDVADVCSARELDSIEVKGKGRYARWQVTSIGPTAVGGPEVVLA